MHRRSRTIGYIILALIAIGILTDFGNWLIPLVVFGLVFYFYKFPPNRFRRGSRNRNNQSTHRNKTSRKAVFHVIKGNKKDDEEPPHYH